MDVKSKLQERFLQKMRRYGSMESSFGCFSLKFGVLQWSIGSLFLGAGLLFFVSFVEWQAQDVVHLSFEVQKEVRATFFFGPGKARTENEDETEVSELEKKSEEIAEQLDTLIKIVTWLYAFLCTVRGIVGCVGVGLKDPGLIKVLWYITITGFMFDVLIYAAFPIGIHIQRINVAWYIWLWLLFPLVYIPYMGWYTCEMIFSFYRIVDMGGTGDESASPADLEALLLPDKATTPSTPRHSLAYYEKKT